MKQLTCTGALPAWICSRQKRQCRIFRLRCAWERASPRFNACCAWAIKRARLKPTSRQPVCRWQKRWQRLKQWNSKKGADMDPINFILVMLAGANVLFVFIFFVTLVVRWRRSQILVDMDAVLADTS